MFQVIVGEQVVADVEVKAKFGEPISQLMRKINEYPSQVKLKGSVKEGKEVGALLTLLAMKGITCDE